MDSLAPAKQSNLLPIQELAFFLFLLLSFGECFAQLKGTMRASFMAGAEQSCFATQRAASVNAAATDGILKRYCKCQATYLADSLNNELAIEIFEGRIKMNPSLVEIATNYCRNNFMKY